MVQGDTSDDGLLTFKYWRRMTQNLKLEVLAKN